MQCNFYSCFPHELITVYIIEGQQDIPLSDVGLQQATLVGKRLQNECFTHIFSSDLSRASQTAQTILDVNKIKKADILQDKRLRERVKMLSSNLDFLHYTVQLQCII